MLGVIATVVLIATTGAYGSFFDLWFKEKFGIDPQALSSFANFCNADFPINLYRREEIEQEFKNGLIFSTTPKSMVPAIPAAVPATLLLLAANSGRSNDGCQWYHGITFQEPGNNRYGISSFRWIVDPEVSEPPASYFILRFELPSNEKHLHLTIPVLPQYLDEVIEKPVQILGKIGYISSEMEQQLMSVLNGGSTSMVLNFEWLAHHLMDFGVFPNNSPVVADPHVDDYVTRPVLLPRNLIDSLIQVFSSCSSSTSSNVPYVHRKRKGYKLK